jgi:hypothetical protein
MDAVAGEPLRVAARHAHPVQDEQIVAALVLAREDAVVAALADPAIRRAHDVRPHDAAPAARHLHDLADGRAERPVCLGSSFVPRLTWTTRASELP